MNSFISTSLVLFAFFTYSQACTNPKFSNVRTSVTQDSKLNTETAYVVQFNVKCAKNAKNALFYGELNGNYLLASSDESGEKFQVKLNKCLN